MSRKIFISHVFEDAQYVGNIRDWVSDPDFGFTELVVETQKDFRPDGAETIRIRLKKSIQKCHALIVLVGSDTHNKDWIRIEAEIATSIPIPVVCIRIPNSTGAKPKSLVNMLEVPFQKKKVKAGLLNIQPKK